MSYERALLQQLKVSPYTRELCGKIESNRSKLNGELFIDFFLRKTAGIQHPSTIYPPKNFNGLLKFIDAIEPLAEQSSEKYASIVYYIFLDYPLHLTEPHLADDTLAGYYADQCDMSAGFRQVMSGIWHMDRLELEEGLTHLAFPENNTDLFHEKVLQTLASVGNNEQIVAYVTALNPKLATQSSLDIYMNALCTQSLYSAIRAARNLSPDAFGAALSTIVNYALTSSDKKNVLRLANFSFTSDENEKLKQILTDYMNQDDNIAARDNSRDVLLVRSLHLSDTNTAKCTTNAIGGSSSDWQSLVAGLDRF